MVISLEVLCGEGAVVVLVLLLESEHQSLEAGIEPSIDHQSIPADDAIDEFLILWVYFGVVAFAEVVDPVILRVVLDIGVNAVDAFHH
jgi:hypothetical protein